MAQHRVFVPADAISGQKAVIAGNEAHHIRDVLRLGRGDEVVATDGEGGEYLLRIEAVDAGAILCAVLQEREPACPETACRIILMQCCLSSGKMDFVVQKATEMGASSIIPVTSERSKFRGDPRASVKKVERWRRVARAASLQCGRAVFPKIERIVPLTAALSAPAGRDVRLVFTPDSEASRARDALSGILAGIGDDSKIFLLIGPEPGFSQVERRVVTERGFVPVRLGHRTLRAETAPIVALALVLYELGEL